MKPSVCYFRSSRKYQTQSYQKRPATIASAAILPMTIPATVPVDGVNDFFAWLSSSTAYDVPDDDAAVEMLLDNVVGSAAEGAVLILLIRLSMDVLTSEDSDWPGVRT